MPNVSENYCCACKTVEGELVQVGGPEIGFADNPGNKKYESLQVGVDCVCKALIGFGDDERLADMFGVKDILPPKPPVSAIPFLCCVLPT